MPLLKNMFASERRKAKARQCCPVRAYSKSDSMGHGCTDPKFFYRVRQDKARPEQGLERESARGRGHCERLVQRPARGEGVAAGATQACQADRAGA